MPELRQGRNFVYASSLKSPAASSCVAGMLPKRLEVLEIILVPLAAVALIRAGAGLLAVGTDWFIAPSVLIAAAVIPTAFRSSGFSDFRIEGGRDRLAVLCGTCAVVFPVTLLGIWMLNRWSIVAPLAPAAPAAGRWPAWLCYQFLYVAVSEELFFRGYLLSRIRRLLNHPKADWIAIMLSAACFAAAHIVVQGRLLSGMTFVPGCILGWMFLRTRSLLVPIAFHGLANIFYCLASSL